MNLNKALWEKGDFTEIAAFMRQSGEAVIQSMAITPPLRVPMVCMVSNRALDDPGAFGVEHNDALVVRDLGWLLIWRSEPVARQGEQNVGDHE